MLLKNLAAQVREREIVQNALIWRWIGYVLCKSL